MRARPGPESVVYGVVFALHLVLLWALPFFPSEDGPSHVYNALIVRDLIHGGQTYGAFFNLHLTLAPNLGAVVPLYALMSVVPPLVAEKVFLTLVMSLMTGVMPRLARMVGGEPYPGSFVVFPLLYSAIVMYGFYSLLLGQAMCLWAIWCHWQMRHREPWQQWAVTTCSAIVLFLCHLLAFAMYLLAVGVGSLLPAPSAPPLGARVRTAALQLAVPALLLAWYAWSLATVTPSVAYASPPATPGLLSGLDWDLNLVAAVYLFSLAEPALALNQLWTGLAAGFVLVWLFLRPGTRLSCRWPAQGSDVGEDAVAARRWLLAIAGVLILGMVVAPDAIGELQIIKLRFPAFVCLLIVPLASCVTPWPALRRVLVTVCLLAAAVNAWYVAQYARQMQTLVMAVPLPPAEVRGRFVAGYLGEKPEGLAKVLLHATSYYCALNECVDPGNYQAFLGHFFVSFKADPTLRVASELDLAGTKVQWERYPGVAYVRGWRFDERERRRLARTFDLVGEAGGATVWKAR